MTITTHYDPKPIPLCQFDWTAYDSETRDIGRLGATAAAAIADLCAEIEFRGGAITMDLANYDQWRARAPYADEPLLDEETRITRTASAPPAAIADPARCTASTPTRPMTHGTTDE